MPKFLEALFGKDENGNPVALTYEQLEQKLKENNEIKLVNLKDGGYVSQDKFDSKETEINGLRKQLEDANKTIKSYEEMDVEGIKKSVKDWEEKYKTETEALSTQLKAKEREYQQDLFLRNYKFSSKAAAEGVKAEFLKRDFPFENGKFLGATEFIEGLMADDDYKNAFVVESKEPAPTEPKPTEPQPTPQPKPQFSDSNPQQMPPKPKKTLSELMRMKNENNYYMW